LSEEAVALDGESHGLQTRPQGSDPLARFVFAALVVACFAAFFVTQRLKHTPTTVQSFHFTPVFSPTPAGHLKKESISFKLDRAEAVTVAIIDSSGNVVATLVRDRLVVRYKQFSLLWNGRRGTASRYDITRTSSGRGILDPLIAGALAPAGEYRVQVSLDGQSKVIRSPRSFRLVRP